MLRLEAPFRKDDALLEAWYWLFFAVVDTMIETVPVWLAPRVTLPGLTAQVASLGAPEQVRVIAPVKVLFAARFNVSVPVAPACSVRLFVLEAIVKVGVTAPTLMVRLAVDTL